MDVRLTPGMLQTLQRALQSGSPTAAPGALTPAVAPATTGAPGAAFSSVLGDALKGVSASQQHASAMQRSFQSGVEGVGLEETMVAMQKAQIGFQAALTVRNRLVQAYTDVMNMSV